MTAYYNEIDPFAAEWLRNLIAAGLIAPGDVDERSIEDVSPDDLRGYTQCHFFAGIGVWSYALRRAGWPDDRPVWTGSCPCPPFSAAGKGSECPSCGGKSCLSHPLVTAGWVCLDCGDEWRGDDRHLLPEFIRLKGQCRPPVVFGEQVASRDGRLWLYTLRAVMEEARYAVGAADLCAAGVGAPHIRQRLWFVAERLEHPALDGREQRRAEPSERSPVSGCAPERLADAGCGGDERGSGPGEAPGAPRPAEGEARERQWSGLANRTGGTSCGLADADGRDACAEGLQRGGQHGQQPQDGGACGLEHSSSSRRERRKTSAPRHDADREASERQQGEHGAGVTNAPRLHQDRPGPVNGFWRDADWLFCRDGKWRPVEPGTFPLAHGAPARVGRLRAYGNAIVAQAAQLFIEAYLETKQEQQHGCQENPDPGLGRSVEG